MVDERDGGVEPVSEILIVRIVHPAAVYVALDNCAKLRNLLGRAWVVGPQRFLRQNLRETSDLVLSSNRPV